MSNIGLEIKKRREALGWTQKELALRAGIHPNTVVAYEKCKREPQCHVVIDLLGAMGYSLAIVPKGVNHGQKLQ